MKQVIKYKHLAYINSYLAHYPAVFNQQQGGWLLQQPSIAGIGVTPWACGGMIVTVQQPLAECAAILN